MRKLFSIILIVISITFVSFQVNAETGNELVSLTRQSRTTNELKYFTCEKSGCQTPLPTSVFKASFTNSTKETNDAFCIHSGRPHASKYYIDTSFNPTCSKSNDSYDCKLVSIVAEFMAGNASYRAAETAIRMIVASSGSDADRDGVYDEELKLKTSAQIYLTTYNKAIKEGWYNATNFSCYGVLCTNVIMPSSVNSVSDTASSNDITSAIALVKKVESGSGLVGSVAASSEVKLEKTNYTPDENGQVQVTLKSKVPKDVELTLNVKTTGVKIKKFMDTTCSTSSCTYKTNGSDINITFEAPKNTQKISFTIVFQSKETDAQVVRLLPQGSATKYQYFYSYKKGSAGNKVLNFDITLTNKKEEEEEKDKCKLKDKEEMDELPDNCSESTSGTYEEDKLCAIINTDDDIKDYKVSGSPIKASVTSYTRKVNNTDGSSLVAGSSTEKTIANVYCTDKADYNYFDYISDVKAGRSFKYDIDGASSTVTAKTDKKCISVIDYDAWKELFNVAKSNLIQAQNNYNYWKDAVQQETTFNQNLRCDEERLVCEDDLHEMYYNLYKENCDYGVCYQMGEPFDVNYPNFSSPFYSNYEYRCFRHTSCTDDDGNIPGGWENGGECFEEVKCSDYEVGDSRYRYSKACEEEESKVCSITRTNYKIVSPNPGSVELKKYTYNNGSYECYSSTGGKDTCYRQLNAREEKIQNVTCKCDENEESSVSNSSIDSLDIASKQESAGKSLKDAQEKIKKLVELINNVNFDTNGELYKSLTGKNNSKTSNSASYVYTDKTPDEYSKSASIGLKTTSEPQITVTYSQAKNYKEVCSSCQSDISVNSGSQTETLKTLTGSEEYSVPKNKYALLTIIGNYSYYQSQSYYTEIKTGNVITSQEYESNSSKDQSKYLKLDNSVYPIELYRPSDELTFTLKYVNLVKEKDNEKSYSCEVKTYNELFEFEDGKGELKYYFRPVDLTNLFPNNRVGVNWQKSYDLVEYIEKQESNNSIFAKEPQYVITLTSEDRREIRSTNSSRTYNDFNFSCKGYFCTSSFLDDLFGNKFNQTHRNDVRNKLGNNPFSYNYGGN